MTINDIKLGETLYLVKLVDTRIVAFKPTSIDKKLGLYYRIHTDTLGVYRVFPELKDYRETADAPNTMKVGNFVFITRDLDEVIKIAKREVKKDLLAYDIMFISKKQYVSMKYLKLLQLYKDFKLTI